MFRNFLLTLISGGALYGQPQLHSRLIVMEPSTPLVVEMTGMPVERQVRLSLYSAGKQSKLIRELGQLKGTAQFSLHGTPDGTYRLHAEAGDGPAFEQTIAIAAGIHSDVEKRLSKIAGHESAKASVRWPFDIARVVNTGIRKLETTDFGLNEAGTQYFDFAKALGESNRILAALEAGKDPLARAKGDHERHYWFADTGEIMPYRVYVPSTWDGKKQLPMIFVLHGSTRDHNFYFDRDGGILGKLAEKNGYIVATTMGYRPNAGYRAGNSESDAMQSLELIVKEFNPDPKRIYLFGHSAGGTGGWYLGTKYSERFAGLALSAFGTQPGAVQFDRLQGIPLLVIVGSKDAPRTVETARTMAKAVAEKGFDTQFLEIPEATHDTIVGLALPTVFQFFNTHGRK